MYWVLLLLKLAEVLQRAACSLGVFLTEISFLLLLGECLIVFDPINRRATRAPRPAGNLHDLMFRHYWQVLIVNRV